MIGGISKFIFCTRHEMEFSKPVILGLILRQSRLIFFDVNKVLTSSVEPLIRICFETFLGQSK